MKNLRLICTLLCTLCLSVVASAQARLTVENNSQRVMTVKVMRGTAKGALHESMIISPWSNKTVYFSESGLYFTKTKAVSQGRDPIFRKGNPFQVTNNSNGYSVMTLTFSIQESAVPQATGGRQISKAEFDQN